MPTQSGSLHSPPASAGAPPSTLPPRPRGLHPPHLLQPTGVAIIGASADPHKLSHGVLRNMLSYGYQGSVYPVNPRADAILGNCAIRHRQRARSGRAGGADGAGCSLPRRADGLRPARPQGSHRHLGRLSRGGR